MGLSTENPPHKKVTILSPIIGKAENKFVITAKTKNCPEFYDSYEIYNKSTGLFYGHTYAILNVKEINGFVIAESISKSLLKKAVAISVNGEQKDLCDSITEDSEIKIITRDSDEGLEIMRHTLTAQVLARAIKIIYPKAKLAIGPTIENGFYYDVLFEKPISIDDFPLIEKEMKTIDIVKIVKILLEEDSSSITGQVLHVGGV